ncbi:MAG: hypothetical protein ABEJ98_04255 [Candidatus Nanohaloarchaea archaeon]
MGWYATEELDKAWQEARGILLPFDAGTWARLILIVVLTGNGFSMPNMPSSLSSGSNGGSSQFETTYGADSTFSGVSGIPELSMTGMATSAAPGGAAIGVIVLVALGLVLGFFYLSSVFEFIFYQSLLDKEVSIRDNFRKFTGRGARYFGFRLAVIAIMILAIVGTVAGFVANPLAGGLLMFAIILALIPVMVFMGITQNFVLLGMMENNTGLIQAWKEFYPTLREQWKEVAVYLLVRFAINIGIGVAALIWAIVSLIVLLIPFGILTALFYMVSPVLAAIPVILGVIAWLIALVGLQVVFQTYLYYYAILVYHDLTA